MTLQLKYLTYMLGRMRHLAFLTYRDIAVDNGILIAEPCHLPGWKHFRLGPTSGLFLNGDQDHDTVVLGNLVTRHCRSWFRSEDLLDDDSLSDAGSLAVAQAIRQRLLELDATPGPASSANANLTVGYVLSLLRSIPRSPRADDAAVAVLLATSLDDSLISLDQLSGYLGKSAWRFGLGGSLKGLSSVLGRLLESGALLPRQFRIRDGNNGYSITGRVHRDSAVVTRRTVISFTLTELHDVGPERARRLTEKTLRRRVPVLIADEEGRAFPPRLVAGLDLVLLLPPLDISMLAVITELCTGLPTSEVKGEMLRRGLSCDRLGLDHLVLAIAPGRSAAEIVDRLMGLVDDAEDDETKGVDEFPSRVWPSKDTKLKQKQVSGSKPADKKGAAVIQPTATESGTPGPIIESLPGYGPARHWALDLKADLALWREGSLPWSEMSTKLLLSGPPGVGKTTFARALCNSLKVPLYASSVATWLEPGYLGEVLKRMSNTFSAAQANAPAILFIDEIDGIGKRSSVGRSHEDYWVQVVNRALELLDGAIRSEGLIIIGATNHPERIDPALLRSGRLEDHIAIPLPDTQALTDILQYHLDGDLGAVLQSRNLSMPNVSARQEEKDTSNV